MSRIARRTRTTSLRSLEWLRTYANVFGLVERYIIAKLLRISERYTLGDQTALEALVRFSDEELKHQELFRRIEALTAQCMPDGFRFLQDAN